MSKLRFLVPEMSCSHCAATISSAVGAETGVSDVDVDLVAKRVEVSGEGLDPAVVERALRAVGYEPVQP